MPVAGELDAGRPGARREIIYERRCRFAVALADIPRRNKLRVGIEPHPRPDIAGTFGGSFRGVFRH